MSPIRPLLPMALLMAMFVSAAPLAAKSSLLEERMTSEEFKSAGLDQLTPDQLRFLNSWLGNKGIAASVGPLKKRDGTLEFYPDDSDREIIESRISGPFEGWRGTTIVKLENGQKWQQSESGSRGDVNMQGPAVTIKPMSMGSWLMIIKGCNCSIRVKRIG